jgi:DNA replication and repair protein RecF
LARLRLRDFRNYVRLEAEFAPGFHLLVGANAQGKTNLLEAIYLLSTLRSFRGVGSAQLVRSGQVGYFVGASVVGLGEREIRMYWSAKERRLSLDGQPVRRLTEYLGVLRTVVFCTEDLQLIKGPARVRRRYLDLLLAQTQADYLPVLQRYARALRARNALLKKGESESDTLESFTRELVRLGAWLMNQRRALVPILEPMVQQACHRIASGAEIPRLVYQPSVKEDMAVELAQSIRRERVYRSTLVGPHRDELGFYLDQHKAAEFGSEGQKRTLAIALKMAQAEYLNQTHGTAPILLIDDVMGELDARRRSGMIPLLDEIHRARSQVFMTCTEENWPGELGGRAHRWIVSQGGLVRGIRSGDHGRVSQGSSEGET